MNVTTAELREVFEMLLVHLEQTGHSEVEIQEDFYWSISADERYRPETEPTAFTLGQLSDDLAETRAIMGGDKEPIAYALVWLAAVLRRIGEKVVA